MNSIVELLNVYLSTGTFPHEPLELGVGLVEIVFVVFRDRYLFRLDALRQQQALESEGEDDDDEEDWDPEDTQGNQYQ